MYVTRRVNLRNVDDFAAVRGGRSLTFDEWAEGLTIGQVDEESYEEEEDEAQLAATLARFEPAHALGLLTAKLGEVTAGLAQGEAGADVAAAALLELSMLTLSDSAHGETPTVPARLLAASQQAGDACPVVALIAAVRQCGAVVLQAHRAAVESGQSRRVLVPLVELLDGYGRLAPTYLMLERAEREYRHVGGVSPALLAALSLGGGGAAMVTELVDLGVATVAQRARDAVSRRAVGLLLRLGRLKSLRGGLTAQPSWQHLLELFCTSQPAVVGLPKGTVRMLGEAVCCAGLASPEAAAPYMGAVHTAIGGGLQGLLSAPEFGPAIAAEPEGAAAHQALHYLSCLRGIAKVCEPGVGSAVYGGFGQILPLMVGLVEHGSTSARLVPSLCKLLGLLIEGFAMCMPPDQCAPVFTATADVLQAYAGQREAVARAVEALAAGGRQQAAADLKYKHVVALLGLLSKLQDALFGVDGEAKNQLVALIFSGLQIVVPFVDGDMLAYPKLRQKYLDTVAQSVDGEPGKVIELPPELFAAIMSSLEYGIDVVVRLSPLFLL